MDGLILIDKPRGPSSFDVVRNVRSVADTSRVGHCGTLDPDASGVLGVAIGRCTRLAQYVVMDEKVYTFEVVFGSRTDTDDATGQVVEEGETSHLRPEAIEAALPGFVGRIAQVPPRFSAIRVEGERAYERARRGEEFEIPAREVTVHEASLVEWRSEEPSALIEVRCGSGTYMRSIARDLGRELQSPAHARDIRRTRVGPFEISRAIPLGELDEERLATALLSPAEMVASLPTFTVGEERKRAIGLGQRVVVSRSESDLADEIGSFVAVLDDDGQLVAITVVERTDSEGILLKPKRVMMPLKGPGGRE